jgi:hypothetical protein
MSNQAAAVQVHSQISSVLDGCTKLGPVTATTSQFQMDSNSALNAQLREATATLGGDSVALVHTDETLTQYVRHGIAFRCF